MHGNVSFVELGTSDTERSRPFFQRVFGWTFTPMAQGGGWREGKPILPFRRNPDSAEWPFAVTRKASVSAFTSNLVTEP